jgi:two-component system nitrate/nitrite sensor histidine kinase NarX
MLTVARDGGDEFSTHDIRLIRSFGAQASILLERSLLYEEIEAGAILQERSRLAREIHDGLAQHLAFLKMRVSWLKRSPTSVDAQQLEDVEGVLETALIEARHAITTLRAEPQGTTTVEAIAAYAEEFGQVSGLEVQVTRAGMVPEVGPKTRVELLRIVQEALNNVRKHASASEIDIEVGPWESGVQVTVRDDGVGFEVDAEVRGHFGLQIMRERAESVGGRLEVDSAVRSGTAVTIWMPGHDSEPEPSHTRELGLAQG